MAPLQPYQPDLAGSFARGLQIREALEASRDRDRKRRGRDALAAGNLDEFSKLDPEGYATYAKNQREGQKAEIDMANTEQQMDTRRGENTRDLSQRLLSAAQAGADIGKLRKVRDTAVAQQHVNMFELPGDGEPPVGSARVSPDVYWNPETADTPAGVVPPVAPEQRQQQITQLQRMAGVEDPYAKPTGDMMNYQQELKDPQFAARNIALRQAGAGTNPIQLAMTLKSHFDQLPDVKNYGVMQDAITKIRAAKADGAGDIGLIFGYMKLLDPNSTVREGEFDNAVRSGGVPSSIAALYNKVQGSGILDEKTRRQVRQASERLAQAQSGRYKRQADNYQRIARKYGIDPGDIVFPEDGAHGGGADGVDFGRPGTVYGDAPPQAAPRKQFLDEYDQLTGGQ